MYIAMSTRALGNIGCGRDDNDGTDERCMIDVVL